MRKTQSTKQSILIAFVENMAKRQIKKYSLGQKLKPDKLSGKRYPKLSIWRLALWVPHHIKKRLLFIDQNKGKVVKVAPIIYKYSEK